jgi:hypothetical protein
MAGECSSEQQWAQSQKSPSTNSRKLSRIGISRLQAYESTLDDKRVLLESSDAFESNSSNSKCIWRLSDDETTWNFRKLIACDDYLYILSSTKSRENQVVDRIPMSSICNPRKVNSHPSFPAYRFSESSVQNRRKMSIFAPSPQFKNFTSDYCPQYDTTTKVGSVANLPPLDVHAFTFRVDVSEFRQRNAKRKKQGAKKDGGNDLPHKEYIFHTGSGQQGKECCERWIQTIEDTSRSAKRTALWLKWRKRLQGSLREVYNAMPFQVPRHAPYILFVARTLVPRFSARSKYGAIVTRGSHRDLSTRADFVFVLVCVQGPASHAIAVISGELAPDRQHTRLNSLWDRLRCLKRWLLPPQRRSKLGKGIVELCDNAVSAEGRFLWCWPSQPISSSPSPRQTIDEEFEYGGTVGV